MVFRDHTMARLSVNVRTSLKIANGYYEQYHTEVGKTRFALRLMRKHCINANDNVQCLAERAKQRADINQLTTAEKNEVFALASKVKETMDRVSNLIESETKDSPTLIA